MADEVLGSKEEQEFLDRLSEIARSGLPIAEGLRAAAQEVPSRRLQDQFVSLAEQSEAGAGWEDILQAETCGVRPHVLGILRAGIRSGKLADALDSLVDQQRVYHDIRRHLFSVFAYPAVLCVAAFGLFLLVSLFVVPEFEVLYGAFGIEVPAATVVWLDISKFLPKVLLAGFGALVVIVIAVRLIFGRSGWMRFVAAIPILGTLVHFAGVSQMLRLLAILLRQQMPLPQALELTTSGVANAHVQELTSDFAEGVAGGISFSKLVDGTPDMPGCISPLLAWGESNDRLPKAVKDAHELLEGYIRLHQSIIALVLGPLLLVLIAGVLGSLVTGLVQPMISLIQNLT